MQTLLYITKKMLQEIEDKRTYKIFNNYTNAYSQIIVTFIFISLSFIKILQHRMYGFDNFIKI